MSKQITTDTNIEPSPLDLQLFSGSLIMSFYPTKTEPLIHNKTFCGTVAGEGWSGGFRVWCQRRLTRTAVLHHLVLPSLFQ